MKIPIITVNAANPKYLRELFINIHPVVYYFNITVKKHCIFAK